MNRYIEQFSEKLITFLKVHNKGLILLGGGSTPQKINDFLCSHYNHNELSLLISKFTFVLTDERYCPSTSEFNNAQMMLDSLFTKINQKDSFINFDYQANYEDYLKSNQNKFESFAPPLLSIIGMGPDGHTASLFPGIFKSDDQNIIVDGGFGPEGLNRISFSQSFILKSKYIWILCNSDDKLEALKIAIEDVNAPLHNILKHKSVSILTN